MNWGIKKDKIADRVKKTENTKDTKLEEERKGLIEEEILYSSTRKNA